MSTKGMSRAQLSRMHDIVVGYVERGEVPGMITQTAWSSPSGPNVTLDFWRSAYEATED